MDGSTDYELKDWQYCEYEEKCCPFCHSVMTRLDEVLYECQNEYCVEGG